MASTSSSSANSPSDPGSSSARAPGPGLLFGAPTSGRLPGRRAIVTGAARGIGASIASALAAEGASVAVIDQSAEGAHAVAGRIGGVAVIGDLRDPASAASVTNEAVERLGGLDILVNNAGVLMFSSILDMSVADWDLTFEINVRSMLITTQIAARRMIAQRSAAQGNAAAHSIGHDDAAESTQSTSRSWGKIINMASMGGKLGSPMQAHYAASKAAVISFTRVCAMEFGEYGINVNCICPGYVLTEMGADTRTPEKVAMWSAKSPLGRLAEPTDVARTALFLASSDSDYCTGQAMNVSGGMVMH